MRFLILGLLIMVSSCQNKNFGPGDKISSQESEIKATLNHGVEIILGKNSNAQVAHFQVTKANGQDNVFIDLDLKKGAIESKVKALNNEVIEYKILTEGAAVTAADGDFKVSLAEDKDVEVTVTRGQVLVSSPFIQSFVPEVVKENETLYFDMQENVFSRKPGN